MIPCFPFIQWFCKYLNQKKDWKRNEDRKIDIRRRIGVDACRVLFHVL